MRVSRLANKQIDNRVARELITKSPTKSGALDLLLDQLQASPDDYTDLEFTDRDLEIIRKRMTHLSTGATAAIPLICGGGTICPFSQGCPFVQIGKPPLGRQCLVEVSLLNEWRRKYILEYDIDPDSMTELAFVNELAECELLLYRINKNLAKVEHGQLVIENAVGMDRDGNTITRIEVSSLFDAKERITKRRANTIKLMVGDRQEKYKREAALRIREDKDPSSSAAELKRELTKLMNEAKDLSRRELPPATEPEEPLTPEDLIAQGDDE